MKTNGVEEQDKKAAGKSAPARRFRWVLIFVVVAVGIGVFVFLRSMPGSSAGSNPKAGTFVVRRGDLTIRVTEGGDIKALNSEDIKSEVEGRTTIISIVDEGTYITPEDVNNGKVLVELDSSDIEQKLTQQEITFLTAQASLTEAKESLDIQKKQNDSDIQAGRMKARFALMDFKKYLGSTIAEKITDDANCAQSFKDIDIVSFLEHPELGGEALQELRKLTDDITLAESKFEQASTTLMWTERLHAKDYVAQTKLREDQLEVQSRKIQMVRAKTALKLLELYEFPKETEKLFSDYQEARRELERIEARARSKLAQAEAKLGSGEAKYLLQKERLAKLRRQLEACVIRAPSPGQVVYSSSMLNEWQRQRRLIEVGAEVRQRQKIISIPDTSEMKVEIKVHETWVDKVRPGQEARITIAAFPDEQFTGRVLKKAPLADPQNWLNPDLKVYVTDVSIDGTHDFIKTGMSAKVEVIIDELHNVLSVPIQSITTRDGVKVCYCLTDSGPERRVVETGAFNDDFVEVKSGLAEAEVVLLNPPRLIKPASVAELKQRQKPSQNKIDKGRSKEAKAPPGSGQSIKSGSKGHGAEGRRPPPQRHRGGEGRGR